MSDDTPTQRYPEGFPPAGSNPPVPPAEPTPTAPTAPDGLFPSAASEGVADAPTERFAAPATIPPATAVPPAGPPASATPPTSGNGGNNRGLIITLAVLAGVLLLALIGVLIWIAVAGGSPAPEPTATGSNTPSPTPTESESPTPTPTPTETTAPPPANVITSFTGSTSSVDCTGQGGGSVPIVFSWVTTGTNLWFGIGTDDAFENPYAKFPTTYTTTDADGIAYQCGQPEQQQSYTITVQRSDGSFQSQTLIVKET